MTIRALCMMGMMATSALALSACGGGQAATTTPDDGAAKTDDGGSTSGESSGGEATAPEEGKKAPEINGALYVTGEGPKSIAEAKGKVTIVDFWGTFCKPCKASFPKYQEMKDQFGDDLAIIAVSADDPTDADEGKIKDFVKATGVKFTILWDKEQKNVKVYNPPNMPTSYLLDKDGVIRHIHAKYNSGDEQKIADQVKTLIGK